MNAQSLTSTSDPRSRIDAAFVGDAMKEADLNALRLALYQATGDEALAAMRVERVEMAGGAMSRRVLAPEHHDELAAKIAAFVNAETPTPVLPDDREVRRLIELFQGRTLSDVEFDYHRALPAFEEFPHAARWRDEKPDIPKAFRVAIVGAGVSGIVSALQFERLGIPYTVYERRHELGGTWSVNAYPSVRVDTSNFIYQYSFEKNFPWTEYFATQGEIRSYLEAIARKYGVFDKIVFNSKVTSASFDEDAAVWRMTVNDEVVEANVVIAASGLFGTARKLDTPGIDDFSGEIIHTTDWHTGVQYAGRNVAVIGNGSTGVQLLATIAAEARQVTLFQRTPQWITPRERYGEKISAGMRWLLDTVPYFWNWTSYSAVAASFDLQDLQDVDYDWQANGGQISDRNDKFRAELKRYIASQLGDREDLIAKVTPRHAPMARRLVVDNGWYKSLLRDNVELVTDGIERITAYGIVTTDGVERPIDLIISATGFEATRYVWPMDYFGLGGVSLHDVWEAHGTPRAYLGIAVPDFPNLFIHYGPNSQTRAGSHLTWQETWAGFSAQAVADMLSRSERAIHVKPEVFERYNTEMDERAQHIVWSEPLARQRSYYVDANGRSSVNSPWRVEDYYQFFIAPSAQTFEPV